MSPIKQRINFIKTVNPVLNSRLVNENEKLLSQVGDNSRIIHTTITTGVSNEGSRIEGSQVEVG